MDSNDNKELFDLDTLIDYAQFAVYTLKNSGSEITAKQIKEEIIMLHKKFGTNGVRKLNKVVSKTK